MAGKKESQAGRPKNAVESKMPHMCIAQVIGQILDRSLGARCLCLACAVNHARIVSAGVLSGLCRHCVFFLQYLRSAHGCEDFAPRTHLLQ